ncbi:MAG: hypothetical protein SYC29_14990 [Planctomycetota bacterium]|nr:hypothetical protein [Planctomycetota bacterium]
MSHRFTRVLIPITVAMSCAAQAAVAQDEASIVGCGSQVAGADFRGRFISIAAGGFHSLGLMTDGSIVAWGSNGDGECDVPEPNTDFIRIAAGEDHNLGLKADGSIVAWGGNSHGQCNVPEPNSGFVALAADYEHSLGLKADGSIVAWGGNSHGQCNVPEPNSGFVALAAGFGHSLGVKYDGSIVAWGNNSMGQCDVPDPNTDFVALAAGYGHSLGLRGDGSIVAWGDNYHGQCNVPDPNIGFLDVAACFGHSLGLMADGSIVGWGYNGDGQCDVPEPNSGFVAVAAGWQHSLGLKGDGSILAWGRNSEGQCDVPVWIKEQKLLASDGALDDWFGYSVSISGNNVVIGSWPNDDNGDNSGAAYVFRYDGRGWGEQAKLLASDAEAGDHFGESVSVWGDFVIIGAPYDDDQGGYSGSAYVFRQEGTDWVEDAKLLASDGVAGDSFGTSVSICGDIAVVGAPGDDDAVGSAYVFRYDGSDWVEEATLLASDGESEDLFGYALCISGDTVVIGADGDDDNGEAAGAAYVFRYDGVDWVEEAKLSASDGEPMEFFGSSVSISGDAAVIGAHADDGSGPYSGSAYVFRYNGGEWVEEAKLVASDGATSDLFGYSVSISGDTALIGAYGDDDNGWLSGSVYVFRYDGSDWVEEAKLQTSDGEEADALGFSVSISDGATVVGACWDDDNGDDSGSAYIFRWTGDSCPADFDGDGVVNTADLLFLLGAWGTPDGDVDGDGDTDTVDLLELLGAWGECP